MGAYSVLELPLITEKWQEAELLKKMECGRRIYNDMLSKNLKKYNEMVKTKEWRGLSAVVAEELRASSGDGESEKKGKKKSDRLKAAYDRKNQILRENGFSEFDFGAQAIELSKYYQKHISSTVAYMSIGSPMWKAFEKLLFGNGEHVRFKKAEQLLSLSSDNKSGIRFLMKDGDYVVVMSNRMAKARPVTLKVKFPGTDYEKEMLAGDLKKDIKVVRICHRVIKCKDCFFVQLTVAKSPAIKYCADGSLKHPVGSGKVGVAIWRDELYAVSESQVYYSSLVPAGEAEFIAKREELTRLMEHLRRVANPQNFDENGKVKKGMVGKDGRRMRLKWHFSNHYLKVKAELKELYRVHDVKKEQLQREIVWKLLEMGDRFIFAETSFLTEKPEFDEENPLANAEYRKRKARRRAIQAYAPATLLNRLSMRLESIEGAELTTQKLPEELYWYQHDVGISDKALFAGAFVKVCGEIVPHTAYRAFLIRHFNTTASNVYDQKALSDEFEAFVHNIYE